MAECKQKSGIDNLVEGTASILRKSEASQIEDIGRLAPDFNKHLRSLLTLKGGLPLAFHYLKKMEMAKDWNETKKLLSQLKESVRQAGPVHLKLDRKAISRAIDDYAKQTPNLSSEHTTWLMVLANSEFFKTPTDFSTLDDERDFFGILGRLELDFWYKDTDSKSGVKLINKEEFVKYVKEIAIGNKALDEEYEGVGTVWCTGTAKSMIDYTLSYQIYGPMCEFLDGSIKGWGVIRIFQENYNYERLARTLFPEQVRLIEKDSEELKQSRVAEENERSRCLESERIANEMLRQKRVEKDIEILKGQTGTSAAKSK